MRGPDSFWSISIVHDRRARTGAIAFSDFAHFLPHSVKSDVAFRIAATEHLAESSRMELAFCGTIYHPTFFPGFAYSADRTRKFFFTCTAFYAGIHASYCTANAGL